MAFSTLRVAACIAVLATALAPPPTFAQEKVRVGVPMELSGRFVMFGAQGKRGIDMAVDVYGGKVGNRPIEVLYRDVQSNNQTAITALTELTQQEKVDFILGPVASGTAASMVPVWRQTKPLWIVEGSSSTLLEDAMKGEEFFFHTYPWAYHYHESTAAALVAAMGKGKKVAFVYSDGSYGREHLPWAKDAYTKAGFTVVAEELMREGAVDISPVLQRLRQSRPDIVVGLLQTTDGVLLAKQAYVAKLNVAAFVGTAYPQLQEWSDAVHEAGDGWIGMSTYLPGMKRAGDPKLTKLFPPLADWEADFRKRYNKEPEFHDVGHYVSMMMLLVAIERAGSTDKAEVARKLAKLDVQTLMGDSNFEPSQGGALHQAFSAMIVFQRQGSKLVTLYPPEVADGKMILKR